MPRRNRCVVPGVACHITQRGVDRRDTFSSTGDRLTYLRLVRENLADAGVSVLAYCLMTNHVHLVATPERADSLAVLLRRVHGRYAQYYNTKIGRSGHLWQNRFFACALGRDHLWPAIAYVEWNPVRAGLAVTAAEYPWSSAAARLKGTDPSGILDLEWWQREGIGWAETTEHDDPESAASLRRCTYAGRPFGNQEFVDEMSNRFGRYWQRGRPAKKPPQAKVNAAQFGLFAES